MVDSVVGDLKQLLSGSCHSLKHKSDLGTLILFSWRFSVSSYEEVSPLGRFLFSYFYTWVHGQYRGIWQEFAKKKKQDKCLHECSPSAGQSLAEAAWSPSSWNIWTLQFFSGRLSWDQECSDACLATFLSTWSTWNPNPSTAPSTALLWWQHHKRFETTRELTSGLGLQNLVISKPFLWSFCCMLVAIVLLENTCSLSQLILQDLLISSTLMSLPETPDDKHLQNLMMHPPGSTRRFSGGGEEEHFLSPSILSGLVAKHFCLIRPKNLLPVESGLQPAFGPVPGKIFSKETCSFLLSQWRTRPTVGVCTHQNQWSFDTPQVCRQVFGWPPSVFFWPSEDSSSGKHLPSFNGGSNWTLGNLERWKSWSISNSHCGTAAII